MSLAYVLLPDEKFRQKFLQCNLNKMVTNNYAQVLGLTAERKTLTKNYVLGKKKTGKPLELFAVTLVHNFLRKLQPMLYPPMQNGDRSVLRFTFPLPGPSRSLLPAENI